MEIILTPKKQTQMPLKANAINPDDFAGKTLEEIKNLEIWHGNIGVKLSDFFDVEGESGDTPAETKIIINGDVYNTKRIGQGMTDGEIIINGNTNLYTGVEMEGGVITVNGNTGAWVGQNMKGGEINIFGNTGDYVGSSYRGDWRGMTGGTITVHGDTGYEACEYMLGGKVVIKGDAGLMPGVHMTGGVLIIEGNVIARVGAEMKTGTIVVKGIVDEFLPGFEYLGIEKDIDVEGEIIKGSYHKFRGDFAIKGSDGTVYVAVSGNNHIVP